MNQGTNESAEERLAIAKQRMEETLATLEKILEEMRISYARTNSSRSD